MKGRVLVLGDLNGRHAAALVVDGRLEDLLLDPGEGDPVPPVGSVLPARLDRPAAKTGGVFVRMGQGLTGFLRGGASPKAGQTVPVQVTGYPEPGKAVPVTDRVLFKGRTVILTPGAPGINVSRRIGDPAEHERLAATIAAAAAEIEDAPGGWGWIARSAAEGADEAAIAAEVRWLGARAQRLAGQGEPWVRDALATALSDWTDPRPGMIAAPRDLSERLRKSLIPERFGDAALAEGCEAVDAPFDHFGVEEALAALETPEAALPSGGSLVIEPTRALVAVDVNTGERFSGGAAMTANLEAARELPRQLRLRGLGGEIAVDFAPVAKRDRRRLEDALKTAFRRDPVETSLAGWTPLGHFELSRKRERRPLAPLGR